MRREQTLLLKDIIGRFVKENGLEEGLMINNLFSIFDEIVGANIAEKIVDRRFVGGVAYFTITSSVIKNHLFMQKELIISKLNAGIGSEIVKKIVFK